MRTLLSMDGLVAAPFDSVATTAEKHAPVATGMMPTGVWRR